VYAVELLLVQKLKELLSPSGIMKMDSEILQRIAAESTSAVAQRELLSRKLEVLIAGMETCRRYTNRSVPSMSSFRIVDMCARRTSTERLGLLYVSNHPGAYTQDDSSLDNKSTPDASSVPNPKLNTAYCADVFRQDHGPIDNGVPVPGVAEVPQSNVVDWPADHEPEGLTEAILMPLPKKKKSKKRGSGFEWVIRHADDEAKEKTKDSS